MKTSSSRGLLSGCAVAFLLTASSATALTLSDTTSTFPTTGTLTQTGRLSRNGVPQDFSGSEVFPGSNNAGVTFNYITFTLSSAQLGSLRDVQIELDTQGLGLFASAYLNSYNPPSASNPGGSFATNWLGALGSSADYSSGNTPTGSPDIAFCGATVPANSNLVVVLATSGANGAGAGTPFDLRIEGFSNVLYSDAVPEPSSFVVAAAGLLGLGWAARRRALKSAAV